MVNYYLTKYHNEYIVKVNLLNMVKLQKGERDMYENLIEILKRKGISNKAYAEFLGLSEKTVWNKLQGKTEFTLGEAQKTCKLICPEYKMDYVFAAKQTAA